MAKNLPANAGDTGSILGPGGFHLLRATKHVYHSDWAARHTHWSSAVWAPQQEKLPAAAREQPTQPWRSSVKNE